MKNRKISLFITALVAVTLSAVGFAGSVWKGADEESPMLIMYTGLDTAPVVTVTGLTITLEESSNARSNVFTIGTATNVATILGLANSATGYSHTATAPVYPWKAIRWAALTTDNLTNQMVVATNTLAKGVWNKVFKWDTSLTKHYNASVSDIVGDSVNPLAVKVAGIYGDALGTGVATLTVYEDNTVKFYRTFGVTTNSHLYPTGPTTNTAVITVSEGNLPEAGITLPGGVRIGAGKQGFVRVALSGTATTGGIGATVE